MRRTKARAVAVTTPRLRTSLVNNEGNCIRIGSRGLRFVAAGRTRSAACAKRRICWRRAATSSVSAPIALGPGNG
jgi:hypothetical protein